jgi:folate-binding protein YgfZ
MEVVTPAVGVRPRAFVRVRGPQALDYLQRMLSNDLAPLEPGGSCDALLLTAKGRVIAPLRVLRRADDDLLLLTEPELGPVVRDELLRARFAARAEIELEEHRSLLVLGGEPPERVTAIPCDDYGVPGWEVLDAEPPPAAAPLTETELERMRIAAGTPRFGSEIDDRVLPAEAGLVERAVSFTKGCYPGQEPIARLHYRGHVNRELRVLRIAHAVPPGADAEIVLDGKSVGRVTSAVSDGEGGTLALGYVRVEVPVDARLGVEGAAATMSPPTRP